jgi:MSHA pilin protein MshA
MNKQARTAIPQRAAQGGFTLIELIVVIVILGILAATALPKFSDLSADARAASLNAAAGALRSSVAMTHGQSLVAGNATAASSTVTVEGANAAMVFGYPKGDKTTLTTVLGFSTSDYTISETGGGTVPTLTAGQVAIQPAKNAKAACYVLYTQAASATSPATVDSSAATSANCQ